MNDPQGDVLQRDRYFVIAAMLTLTSLAYTYVAWTQARPATMSAAMTDMTVMPFLFTFVMWAVIWSA